MKFLSKLYKMLVQSSSNVPEYCGLANMEQYVFVLKRSDPKNLQIWTPKFALNQTSDG